MRLTLAVGLDVEGIEVGCTLGADVGRLVIGREVGCWIGGQLLVSK